MKSRTIPELTILVALSLGQIHAALANEDPNPYTYRADGLAYSNIPEGSTYVGCQSKTGCRYLGHRIIGRSSCDPSETVVIGNHDINYRCPENAMALL